MKLILLAAAAAVAMPALAQTTPMASDPAGQAATTPAPAPDGATQMQQPMPAQTTGAMDPQANPGAPPMATPTAGGYQPSTPAMSGPMQPGATVTYQQAPSPDQAYPAPAPLAKYPMCKPGQFDQCMQGPGSTHSRQVHRRRK